MKTVKLNYLKTVTENNVRFYINFLIYNFQSYKAFTIPHAVFNYYINIKNMLTQHINIKFPWHSLWSI